MTLKKILLFGLIILGLGAAYFWFFVYNKSHKNIEETNATYSLTISEIVNEFELQFDSATKKYDGDVVQLTGKVNSIEPNDSISSIVFKVGENYEIYCEVYPRYNAEALTLKPNSLITIKGFFSGAEQPDDMLEIAGVLRLKKCSFNFGE